MRALDSRRLNFKAKLTTKSNLTALFYSENWTIQKHWDRSYSATRRHEFLDEISPGFAFLSQVPVNRELRASRMRHSDVRSPNPSQAVISEYRNP
jgi:hypothetical protein